MCTKLASLPQKGASDAGVGLAALGVVLHTHSLHIADVGGIPTAMHSDAAQRCSRPEMQFAATAAAFLNGEPA